jgi:hypothetical protein
MRSRSVTGVYRLSLCCFVLGFASLGISQTITPNRLTNWSIAGLGADRPTYPLTKNILDFGGSGNGVTNNATALQNAINSLAGQNGTINFPAGTYIFQNAVSLRSGLVLKGEGAGSTILQFHLPTAANLFTIAGNGYGDSAMLPSGALIGDSSFLVDDASPFQPGDWVKIYQDGSSLVNDESALESVGQFVRIDGIDGRRLSFHHRLRRNYLPADSPRVRLQAMVTGVGIECLSIENRSADAAQRSNIYFTNAANCWVKGVESDSAGFAHIRIAHSANIEVCNSYFHDAFSYGSGGEGYGICCEYTSGECLVENNIFRRLRHSMLLQWGANGNVFAYNFSTAPYKTDAFPGDLSGDIVLHGNYPYLNLFEGNIVDNIVIDASHGKNGTFNTLFRNRAASYGIIISSGGGDSTNLVGNEVTGTALGKGNYLMQGSGNFEYGNNKNNSIIPAGTIGVPAESYYYVSRPYFWNSPSHWPAMGMPTTYATGSTPSRERYVAGTEQTFCLDALPTVYTFNGNGNWDESANWTGNRRPPSVVTASSEIIIDPVAGGKCVLNVPYVLNPGVNLTVRPGKNFVVGGNLRLVK